MTVAELKTNTKNETKEVLSQPHHLRIWVAGGMGIGKSTLMRGLGEAWGAEIIDEDFEKNPYLKEAYEGVKNLVFRSQVWFLERKIERLKCASEQNTTLAVAPFVDYSYAETYAQMGGMDKTEWLVYDRLYKVLVDRTKAVPPPDLILKLAIEDSWLIRRVNERGREMEKGVDPEFLRLLSRNIDKNAKAAGVLIIPIDAQYQDFRKKETMVEITEALEWRIWRELKEKFNDPSSGLSLPPFLEGKDKWA